MEDIFQWCREGNVMQVRVWLDDTENDLNQGDDHGLSPLHWAAKEGHAKIVELLLQRGARVNATNRGDDTALHLAAAHGHRDIVHMREWLSCELSERLDHCVNSHPDKALVLLSAQVINKSPENSKLLFPVKKTDPQVYLNILKCMTKSRADVNFINEHGNSPLHYACFWGYQGIAEDLVSQGALVSLANKDGDTPLDKARGHIAKRLHELAVETGQDLKKITFKDQSWLGLKTRSRDPTLSRHRGINISDLSLHTKIASTPSGDTWRGKWQKNDVVAKILAVRECTPRISRDFNEEFPKLRIFSHPNVLPVIGCCNNPPNLVVINQHMPWGSLYTLLHEGAGVVVDTAQALRFAVDTCRGMAYLHSLERLDPRYNLNSRHIMIDEDLTARINMADFKFTFQERARIYYPAWMSPEALQKKPSERNWEACDMWSFAILLWELSTREVPFADLSPMEQGMKIAVEGLRITIPPGISPHLAKLIRICMNEDPGKRPTFDQVLPILDKMKR